MRSMQLRVSPPPTYACRRTSSPNSYGDVNQSEIGVRIIRNGASPACTLPPYAERQQAYPESRTNFRFSSVS